MNIENYAFFQVIKYAKRNLNTNKPNHAASKATPNQAAYNTATPNQTVVVQSVRQHLNTQQIKQALDQAVSYFKNITNIN